MLIIVLLIKFDKTKLLTASLGLLALAYGADEYAANPHIYYDCH